jgi:hypothetical protein
MVIQFDKYEVDDCSMMEGNSSSWSVKNRSRLVCRTWVLKVCIAFSSDSNRAR